MLGSGSSKVDTTLRQCKRESVYYWKAWGGRREVRRDQRDDELVDSLAGGVPPPDFHPYSWSLKILYLTAEILVGGAVRSGYLQLPY